MSLQLVVKKYCEELIEVVKNLIESSGEGGRESFSTKLTLLTEK